MGIRDLKMRTFFITILALCLANYTLSAQGTCTKASRCNGCTDDTTSATSACSACFNWGAGGDIGARQLSGTSCATAVANKVTDCKYYLNTISATKTINDCAVCDDKTWLNITDNNTAASIAITCSDTASNTTTCAAEVANCEQSLCFTSTAGVVSVGCRACKEGYTGSGTQISNVGYTACSTTGIIANCDYHMSSNNAQCYTCASDYAVASTNTSCTAFTTDSNCRKLSNTWCSECWHAYYFENTTCILAGKLFVFSAFVVAVMTFLS